ncbi:MAG: class I tRNA ligase family protein, partial [Spongiibacteraceae bacterium]|nr:class I tRNA ligase family protein [Spongiibacteraceae bacterium]
AQTALYHISRAMVRWIAPILSFTAEEMWEFIPGEKLESVHLSQWYQDLPVLADNALLGYGYWQTIMKVKSAVNKVLETKRKEGLIGATLEAQVTLYCSGELQQQLQQLGDELRFAMITSSAEVKPMDSSIAALSTDIDGLEITVTKSEHKKCDRCWHYREDVGVNSEHSELCARCVDNVEGKGEQRQFA